MTGYCPILILISLKIWHLQESNFPWKPNLPQLPIQHRVCMMWACKCSDTNSLCCTKGTGVGFLVCTCHMGMVTVYCIVFFFFFSIQDQISFQKSSRFLLELGLPTENTWKCLSEKFAYGICTILISCDQEMLRINSIPSLLRHTCSSHPYL